MRRVLHAATVGIAILIAGLTSLGSGCIATETGNPSATLHPMELDGELLPNDPMLPSPPELALRGGAGSVDPADGVILAWALQNNLPPISTAVVPDGSFFLTLTALPGEALRIQARSADGGYSEPLDLLVDESGLRLATAANPCLRIRPPRLLVTEASPGSEFTIEIDNSCPDTVTRSRARLRMLDPGLEMLDDGPLEMPPGTSGRIRVRVTDASSDPEDIVLFSITSPEPELRAVTFVTG